MRRSGPRRTRVLLYTCFRENGQAGVYLAMSEDGVHFSELNGGKPIFTPPEWPGQNLTRDPSILYRDGLFRMVWTSNWKGRVFGYAESSDLQHWSVPRMVQPFAGKLPEEDQPENIWAPEIHWDPTEEGVLHSFRGDDAARTHRRGRQRQQGRQHVAVRQSHARGPDEGRPRHLPKPSSSSIRASLPSTP